MSEKKFVSGEVSSIEHVILTESIDYFGMKKNTIETIVTIQEEPKQHHSEYKIKTGTIDFKIGDVVIFYVNEDCYHVDCIVDDSMKFQKIIEKKGSVAKRAFKLLFSKIAGREEDKIKAKECPDQLVKYFDGYKQQKKAEAEQLKNVK